MILGFIKIHHHSLTFDFLHGFHVLLLHFLKTRLKILLADWTAETLMKTISVAQRHTALVVNDVLLWKKSNKLEVFTNPESASAFEVCFSSSRALRWPCCSFCRAASCSSDSTLKTKIKHFCSTRFVMCNVYTKLIIK